VNALLDRAENPREVLDYSYAQQQELLRRIRRQLTDVAAARKRAGTQEAQLRRSADRLHDQAEQALAAHRDELGRQALALRSAILDHADDGGGRAAGAGSQTSWPPGRRIGPGQAGLLGVGAVRAGR
jgi:phage shock protein A